jgi:Flp pilus assembly protein TadG
MLRKQQKEQLPMNGLYFGRTPSSICFQRVQPFRKKDESGATLVEAAVVVLVLFTLLLGIVEFGIVALRYHTITTAAREGARFGTAPCQSGDTGQSSCTYAGYTYQSGTIPPVAAVTAYVSNYLKAGGVPVDANSVQVTPEWQVMQGTVNGNAFTTQYRYLRVTVNTHYTWMFFPFGNLPMSATAEMKNEIDILI